MATTLPILRGNTICLENALEDDDNILHRLHYPQKQEKFWPLLRSQRRDLEELVSFHVQAKHCQVADEPEWLSGSYNVCIPVSVDPLSGERVLVRIALPFKLGEANNPGNVDEKLRCEVATYIWMEENCPTVPIPSLYGFAFPNGLTVSGAKGNCCYYWNEHIQRRFYKKHCTQRVFDQTLSPYWCMAAKDVIQRKVEEEAAYKDRLRGRFGALDQ
ncbi:hypothetical protein BDW59DRAFT_160863 [Aspergillus cavernicola]|uniref:Uncharacterized protein n=1 Tax=Aspergillus cavernicola TaxID=176166 RepID=A0ABR4IG07_9EURO